MFGIGSTELLIIAVIALLVMGPAKLPQVMRTLGKGLAEFRRLSGDVKTTLETEVTRMEEEERRKKQQLKAKKDLFPEGKGQEDQPAGDAETGRAAEADRDQGLQAEDEAQTTVSETPDPGADDDGEKQGSQGEKS
jgi:sec-independent protein translocase protein TatB